MYTWEHGNSGCDSVTHTKGIVFRAIHTAYFEKLIQNEVRAEERKLTSVT